jgi:sulfopyruvate decarboxylase TPP-binding subunit
MRIYELRVGDEEESVGVCAGFLDTKSILHVLLKIEN